MMNVLGHQMQDIYKQMKLRASQCAEEIRKYDHVHIVSHIDADD